MTTDIACSGTLISYQGIPVIQIDELHIKAEQRVAIVGPSGSGKTTLAAFLGGFLPDVAEIEGSVTTPERIGAVAQEAYGALNPLWRVLKQMKLTAQDSDRAHELLLSVGLPLELHNRYPLQLSGGQRQRVALAFALATEPELLITDEVTSALDGTTTSDIVDLLRELTGPGTGRTLIFLSHDLDAVRMLCDSVLVVEVNESGPSTLRWEDPKNL